MPFNDHSERYQTKIARDRKYNYIIRDTKDELKEDELIKIANSVYFNPINEESYQKMIDYTTKISDRYFDKICEKNGWNYITYLEQLENYNKSFKSSKCSALYAAYTFFKPNSSIAKNIMIISETTPEDFEDLMIQLREIDLFSKMNKPFQMDKRLNFRLARIYNSVCARTDLSPEMLPGILSYIKAETDYGKQMFSQYNHKGGYVYDRIK